MVNFLKLLKFLPNMLILVVTLFITSFPAIPEPCDYRPTRLTGDDVSKAAIGDVGAGGAVGTRVILVSTPLEWIHLSMLSEFAGPLHIWNRSFPELFGDRLGN